MNHYDVREEFQGGYTTKRSSTRYIVIHHAAALYPQSSGIEDVRAVARYHTQTRGWPGIGYHITLAEETSGGPIARYDVSDLDLERAHVWGRNEEAIGVSCLTNFTGLPAQKWINSLTETLAELVQRYPKAQIVGHGEIALPGHGTACPGPRWLEWKPQLTAALAKPRGNVICQVRGHLSDRPYDNFAAVRQGRGINFPEANINGVPYRLPPLSKWEFDDTNGIWWHLANQMGWVWKDLLQPPVADAPIDDLAIVSEPRISVRQFTANLRAKGSPAAPIADTLYSICTEQGIDPAVVEAIFDHESSMGTAGICLHYNTCSPGNVRRPWDPTSGQVFNVPNRGNFTKYQNWQIGTLDMCKRLRYSYVAQGLDTIRKAIPVWAPTTDGNQPERYISAIISDVRTWQRADQQ